ncbi:antitoxin [Streptosporangium sp. NPDC051023]|uniref:antitoxin n=1 Tax=Streptosporangium sp. NPDC051023 TaxID=3155410 RepID=UPI00344F2441
MSIFDKVKSMLGDHSTKAEELAKQGVDQAAQAAKEKTGGKYDDQIDTAAAKAKEMADQIDGQTDQSQTPGQTSPYASQDDDSPFSGQNDPYGSPDDETPPSAGRTDTPPA